MDKVDKLEELLQKQVADEFRGILKYDEISEEMHRSKDIHHTHIEIIRRIQKEQATHCLELVNMIMDLGYKEPEIIQKLENYFKTEVEPEAHP